MIVDPAQEHVVRDVEGAGPASIPSTTSSIECGHIHGREKKSLPRVFPTLAGCVSDNSHKILTPIEDTFFFEHVGTPLLVSHHYHADIGFPQTIQGSVHFSFSSLKLGDPESPNIAIVPLGNEMVARCNAGLAEGKSIHEGFGFTQTVNSPGSLRGHPGSQLVNQCPRLTAPSRRASQSAPAGFSAA
jgi:hypothetical protein